jgi:hypothetical protein
MLATALYRLTCGLSRRGVVWLSVTTWGTDSCWQLRSRGVPGSAPHRRTLWSNANWKGARDLSFVPLPHPVLVDRQHRNRTAGTPAPLSAWTGGATSLVTRA